MNGGVEASTGKNLNSGSTVHDDESILDEAGQTMTR